MYLFLWLSVITINLIGWLISAVFQTHKNFDIFGTISFCACASVSLVNSPRAFPQRIQTLLVIVWALRLGTCSLHVSFRIVVVAPISLLVSLYRLLLVHACVGAG